LKLICDRERERISFRKAEYWDLKANLLADKNAGPFEAKLVSVKGKRIASGKDFNPDNGKLNPKANVVIIDEKQAKALQKSLATTAWSVISVEEKEMTSRPSQPFITSSLQMEGVRKLGLSAKNTMRMAQKLYEEGLITYMRTDSPNLSQEAIEGARKSVVDLYGKDYLSPSPRQYSAKTKGAQEAHEAIRPAGSDFVHPDNTGLAGKEKALYELIWKRTLATQMSDAKKASMTVQIQADETLFTANGSRIVFPGFLRVYVEGSDDPEAALDDKEVILPVLKKGQQVNVKELQALFHETKPPARFTEASLVQRLEKEGVGRPSTYATIIGTIQDRGYVRKDGTALVPTFTGMAVVQLLEKYFETLVDYSFTREMENSLDEIAVGEKKWLDYLKSFYLGKKGLKENVSSKEKSIKPEECRTIKLNHEGEDFEIKVGRFGPYVIAQKEGKEEVHASIPEDIAPADLKPSDIQELLEASKNGPKPIGVDPKTKENIYCLVGRYGAYLQLGLVTEENPKPRRASLPKIYSPQTVDIETALKLLSLPRELGNHPKTGKPVLVNNGKFGPYAMHDGEFRSLKKEDDVYSVTLERALEILAEEKLGSRGAKLVKEIGQHPKLNKKIGIYDGKYGLYIKMGTKNIGLPDDKKTIEAVEKLAMDEVVKIIDNYTKKK
jgi:DNA topoisomerase-1